MLLQKNGHFRHRDAFVLSNFEFVAKYGSITSCTHWLCDTVRQAEGKGSVRQQQVWAFGNKCGMLDGSTLSGGFRAV